MAPPHTIPTPSHLTFDPPDRPIRGNATSRVAPAVGSIEWREFTARRLVLLDRKLTVGLPENESAELVSLERLTDEALARDCPMKLLSDDDMRIVQKALEVETPNDRVAQLSIAGYS